MKKLIPVQILLLAGLLSCGMWPQSNQVLAPSSEKTQKIVTNLDLSGFDDSATDANVRFFLVDMPIDGVDVSAVNITVHGLSIKQEKEDEEEVEEEAEEEASDETEGETGDQVSEGIAHGAAHEDEDEDEGDKEWVKIAIDPPKTINLLDLQNGLSEVLGDLTLPPGVYKEIRLLVSESEVVLADGTSEVLKIPSGKSSGLKIKFREEGFTVQEGEQYVLVFDFDVQKSLKRKGADNSHKKDHDEDDDDESDDDGDENEIDEEEDGSLEFSAVKPNSEEDDDDDEAEEDGEEDDDLDDEADDDESDDKHENQGKGKDKEKDEAKKAHEKDKHENDEIEGAMWMMKPVIKVLLVGTVQDGETTPIVVDEEVEE